MKMHLDPEKPKRGRTDWNRIDSLSDAQILAAVRKDPDAKPLTRKDLATMRRVRDKRH